MRFAQALILLGFAAPALVRADLIDFETFPGGAPITDSTPITTQFPGLTFTNTTVITAGITLNEFEDPPHSGTNVAFDDGGPLSISFATPITSFSAYFTYYEPLTLEGFDASDTEVASAMSAYSINVGCDPGPVCLGDPGSSPNEFLILSSASAMVNVTITGDVFGSSFVMDDDTYTSGAPEVPEPSTVILLATSLVVLRRFSKTLTS